MKTAKFNYCRPSCCYFSQTQAKSQTNDCDGGDDNDDAVDDAVHKL